MQKEKICILHAVQLSRAKWLIKSPGLQLKGGKERAVAVGGTGRGGRLVWWAVEEEDVSVLELEPMPVTLHGLNSTTSKVRVYFREVFDFHLRAFCMS